MRLNLTLLFLCFTYGIALAQNDTTANQNKASIRGKVLFAIDKPAKNLQVTILGTKKKTKTDDNGYFEIHNLENKAYRLVITDEKGNEKDMQLTIANNQSQDVHIFFEDDKIHLLQDVVVIGKSSKSKNDGIYASKIPLKQIENPQFITQIPKTLFETQLASDYGSILKNVSGVSIPRIADQGRYTFQSRGFQIEPLVRNGVSGYSYSSIDPVNIESVQAIKGPSGTLFGSNLASYGGLLNKVTKKPYDTFGGEVGYSFGSWNFNRITLDVNTPLDSAKNLLLRINSAGLTEQSFQDFGFNKSFSFMPSLFYRLNDKVSFLLDIEYGVNNATSVARFDPYTSSGTTKSFTDLNVPYKRLFGGNDLNFKNQSLNVFGQMNYTISDQWLSQTIVTRTSSYLSGYTSSIQGRSESTARKRVTSDNTNFSTTNFQQNFIGDFKIANHRNRLVVGFDYFNNSATNDRTQVNGPTVDFTIPNFEYIFTSEMVDALVIKSTPTLQKTEDNSYGIYFSNVFNITDNLSVMASLRGNRYQNKGATNLATGENSDAYWQTSFSPKFGLVYEIIKNRVSLFSNYMNGFVNQSGADLTGNVFKPEKANQWEVGAKADLINNLLSGTISYYDIEVTDVVRADPDNPDYNIQDGTQRSKGVEVDITVHPLKGWTIIAGYSYNDNIMTKADPSIVGLRPSRSQPYTLINFWTNYSIQNGALAGFGVGLGGNYGSIAYNVNTQTTKLTVPSYMILDATLYYNIKKYRFGIKLDNFTNEKSWSYRMEPQKPTRFLANVTFRF